MSDRRRCSRALRDEGFPAPRSCAICGLGPCGRLVVGENWPPRSNIRLVVTEFGVVPNRLYGATINENGEAV